MGKWTYYDQRLRTTRQVNFHLTDGLEFSPTGFPVIRAQQAPEVSRLIGFRDILTNHDTAETGVHFFLDDYKFERFWARPEKYLKVLSTYPLVFSPDFSLYTDYPEPIQRRNLYRNQLLGAWLQAQGVCVIPTATWAGGTTYDWCFDGIEPGGSVAVSTVGLIIGKGSKALLLEGIGQLIERKAPAELLIYGRVPADLETELAKAGTPWRRFPHLQAQIARGEG